MLPDTKLPSAKLSGHWNAMQRWRGLLATSLLATVQLTEAYELDLASRGEHTLFENNTALNAPLCHVVCILNNSRFFDNGCAVYGR
jgi:hypothetical protein